ncbi:HAMP domain-containing sensor histidine kinase [Alteromonas sp. 1_MG-2023]|uniref:sensor histidine kinase n=1 Tax=Alteromonas sp. 1_MG-2023 TaxID=3062669 RepID=UPI0026E44B79|nr:HAMP domain-containing sensor histidine kinase [Alteromonas sp. 1_MG-2023]MDO6566036.1 HAMP domain-containing sensor histidine kinase [Alteromonas sp. 1_MG-2023]
MTTSIYKKLVRFLSFTITAVMIVILLITDVAIDTWVHGEFERAMYNKASLLTTLVDEDADGVEFDFAGEFMPEFEGKGKADPEYYQLWRDGEVFERSDTMDLFSTTTFEHQKLKVGTKLIKEITLPDGRSGQILYYSFFPQVDSDDRADFQKLTERTGNKQKPMLLAYALSLEKLNFLTWLIDISFIVAAIAVIFIVRFVVKRAVSSGLMPLEEFSESLVHISLADKTAEVKLKNKVVELLPIQESINQFISDNRKLYLKEQRMTSDMAHELKTPVAELISLAEVTLKFPNDPTLSKTFTSDVLAISKRLENVVSNIMLFHRYTNETFEKNDVFDLSQVTMRLSERLPRIELKSQADMLITSNLFAFETIVSNLLKNAVTYSPKNSPIKVNISALADNTVQLSISNVCISSLCNEDLNLMFDPLWQKDSSRTSTENFGLGLSIVKSFTKALGGEIRTEVADGIIYFHLSLPK